MIRLIVNADDLGANRRRDLGIFRAFRHGILTSASVLANGETTGRAIREANSLRMPLGVHLNLSEGRPLTGPIPGLTGTDGCFPGKTNLRRILIAGCDTLVLNRIREELRAQLLLILDAGAEPDHMDSHQHCHLFAPLHPIVASLAEEFRIRAIRLPSPAPMDNSLHCADPVLAAEVRLYRELAPLASSYYRARGLMFPDGLLGACLLDHLNSTKLASLLVNLPEGTWELMVHPGFPSNRSTFDGPARYRELQALTDNEIRHRLTQLPVQMIHFGHLQCAS